MRSEFRLLRGYGGQSVRDEKMSCAEFCHSPPVHLHRLSGFGE